jgi:hypothetical protein
MKDFYALSPYPRTPPDWDVAQFVDAGSGEAVVLAYRVRGTEGMRVVFPKRLSASMSYEVVDPFSAETLRTASGVALMTEGMRFVLEPESAEVRHLRPA